ncbi:RAM signaling pathway protein-domain-containing protein [Schizophyllum amplum]|uniref:RAM signaling pathway protein-domain-containing protein n=1 Tax=Schizophyllum amplum TaxID=97359 RepID=A0A550CDA7_9AGAR|nr:RAM signaling pathway protein-domain-containing protein [Auriculariopsis ampla]
MASLDDAWPSSDGTLTLAVILEALGTSPDHGATLSFSRLNLTDVPGNAALELADLGADSDSDQRPVERLALGYNKLTALPAQFVKLSQLRYLNLRNNGFAEFPRVLTAMVALDTLDISHNKIKCLPDEPGELVHLRVFCVSKNKLGKLPHFMTQFSKLEVLKVDKNPITYPPKFVLEPGEGATGQAMVDWVESLQRWLIADSPRKASMDSVSTDSTDHPESRDSLDNSIDNIYQSWSHLRAESGAPEFDAGVTPHARSFSVDSTLSASSTESFQEVEPPNSARLPPLHLGILQSQGAEPSPTRSFYLPSPADSVTFFEDDEPSSSSLKSPPSSSDDQHNPRPLSLPDLSTARLNFTKKSSQDASHSSRKSSYGQDDYSIPSPVSTRKDSGSSLSSQSRIVRPFTRERIPPSPPREVPSMAFERNSYFRRLSTLPQTAIKRSLPQPLVCLIDCARSMLFAVVQIHLALERYTTFPIDERLSSLLKKVAEPAQAEMMSLTSALDRFDALSRKSQPPPAVCRGVIESCRDAVSAFGRVVGVLPLQLKVINTDDVRFLRSMLLTLYGATAEISTAWQTLSSQMDAIRPLLKVRKHTSPSSDPSSSSTASPFHHQPKPARPAPPLRTHTGSSSSSTGLTGLRSHPSRRHAGSFSFKDVELGKKMPSIDVLSPPLPSGSRTPVPRGKRHAPSTPQNGSTPSLSSPFPPSPYAFESGRAHSRQTSQTSTQASSRSGSSSPVAAEKTSFFDLPSSAKNQVDKEAVQAVKLAVDIAPGVWDTMEDLLADVLKEKADVRESLDRARGVTKRLVELIVMVQDGDSTPDKKALRDDAHVF